MPLVADLIARVARRSVGVGGRAILLGLGREAHRQHRLRAGVPLDRARPAPIPSGVSAGWPYAAWLCGLAAFALVVLNVHLFLPAGRPVAAFQLALGTILLVEGLGLVVERLPFRRLLRARLTTRSRRGGWPRLVGTALTLLGLVWVAAGVLNVLRGALALI